MRTFLTLLFLLLTSASYSNESKHENELILSTPEEIGSQQFLIKGLVSPLGGTLALRKTDLIVRGAQEIRLDRIYTSPLIPYPLHDQKKNKKNWDAYSLYHHLQKTYKGWQCFPHRFLWVYDGNIVRTSDSNGITLDFEVSEDQVVLLTPPYGMSNAISDHPSGQNSPRNTKISIEESGRKIIVHAPDGSSRIYQHCLTIDPGTYACTLDKEILPNGKILKYHFDFSTLLRVESLSPDEKIVYASLELQEQPSHGKSHFVSSSNDHVTYTYEHRPTGKIEVKRKRLEGYYPPVLREVRSPFYDEEKIDYSPQQLLRRFEGKNAYYECTYGVFGDQYRLQRLLFPVGSGGGFEEGCSFHYEPPVPGIKGGVTTAKHSDQTKTLYRFNKNLLLEAIETHDAEGAIQLQKCYKWTENQWLASIAQFDGGGKLLKKIRYEYDPYGNPVREVLVGDLSGQGEEETYTIQREYSQEGRNLLLREETEEGKATLFEYLPNTNLLSAKFVLDHGRIILREFYVYDCAYNLTKQISDDGSSRDIEDLENVTERTWTQLTLRRESPFIGMPEVMEEKCLENGTEKLIKRTLLTRDQWGNISQEDIYDAEGNYAYTIHRTYNARGDLLTETNPLGQQARYTYNKKGQLESSTNFSNRLEKRFEYDEQGRRIKEEDSYRTFRFAYDPEDHLIEKADEYGNATKYTYDPVTHKIISTQFPDPGVTTRATFDPLGRHLTQTDPNGNTTSYRYNARGKKTHILHPDGNEEHFLYAKNGELLAHTDQEGLLTSYKRDILGRILEKSTPYAKETFSYDAFNLLSKTNKNEIKTHYTYDKFGRKKREETSGRITNYAYDPLGRLACKADQGTLFTEFERDLLGRVTKQSKRDEDGNLFYTITFDYDEDGNTKTITRLIDNQKRETHYTYDQYGRLLTTLDPLADLTETIYDETKGYLETTTVFPNQTSLVETHDLMGRTIRRETLDPENQTLALKEFSYDPSGNLLSEIDHIYQDGQFHKTEETLYTYTCRNKVETKIHPTGRTLAYTYTPSGKVKTQTLEDGTILKYSYTPLGYLQSLTSSDRTIDQVFHYNRCGDLLEAADTAQQTSLKRKLDPFGNILKEELSTGLILQKTYDPMSRVLTLTPNGEETIHYTYDLLFLRQVKMGPYSHIYTEYDLDGNLLQEEQITQEGVHHKLDSKGRIEINSGPFLCQVAVYDNAQNLRRLFKNGQETQYTYDLLDQLIEEKNATCHNHYPSDSNYNRPHTGEIEYDKRGNITHLNGTHYFYDALNQLIEAKTPTAHLTFAYDPLGRRLTKTAGDTLEHYLWDEIDEIGSFTSTGACKTLKVLGKDRRSPVLIQLGQNIYAPVLDLQGSICQLIDSDTTAVSWMARYSAFGELLTLPADNPWCYRAKRLDPELDLVYFGKRYYLPQLGQWLTPDPAGTIDSTNLYQYAYNNPYRYFDEDGEFAIPLVVWGAGVAFPLLGPLVVPILAGAAVGVAFYGGYKIIESYNQPSYDTNINWEMQRQYSEVHHSTKAEEEKKHTNPFDGPVGEDIMVVDPKGNVIPVPSGYQLGASKDGKCIQQKDKDGKQTGIRKDGKGHPSSPFHEDPRSQDPHAHVPGITNSDGTPWLPIYH